MIAKHGDHNEGDGGASPPQGVDLQPRTPDGPDPAHTSGPRSDEAGASQVLLSNPPQQIHESAPEAHEGGGGPALAHILPEHVTVCTEHEECDGSGDLEELPEYQASPGLHKDVDDAVLVAHLQKHGFDNFLGELTCDVLVRYGNSTFVAWMNTGVIWEKISQLMRRHGRSVPSGRSIWTPEEADELRWSTLAEGMRHVQEKIQNGEWDPYGGASLKTYFINACLWKFLNEYRRFWRGKSGVELAMDNITVPRHEPDPEETSIARETIDERLRSLKVGLQRIIHLRALEYTVPEIAELLGLTVKTVECRLSRYYKSNPWEGVGDE
ncbi:sigma-70 family RNA polymerase sigma factor [Streptomyces sp. NPDC005283]|uniref:RNA polymerase sigma factor n=1 Tax=Streptomyces sp. NPDC005283 TaxID=3156871 RepID=UPI00345329AC